MTGFYNKDNADCTFYSRFSNVTNLPVNLSVLLHKTHLNYICNLNATTLDLKEAECAITVQRQAHRYRKSG